MGHLKSDHLNILVRSPNWVGDAIMALPLIHALKKAHPDSVIHILAKPWVMPIWAQHPQVDQVIALKPSSRSGLGNWLSMIAQLRQQHYDWALILPNSFSSAWLLVWSGIKKRVGYRREGRGWLLTHGLKWSQQHDQMARPKVYLHIAQRAGLIQEKTNQSWDFTVHPSVRARAQADTLLPEQPGCTIGLAPGSVAPSRRWPEERYAALIKKLAAQHDRIVLIGSKSDQAIAERVARTAGKQVLITAGKTDLDTGLAVMQKMDLVITNDSGAMHMAYASQVPVLVLQGAADPRVTGPFGNHHVIVRDQTLACAPCVKNICPLKHMACMNNISVDQVFQHSNELLDKACRANHSDPKGQQPRP